MQNKEQIMIDGIDVSKCDFYDRDKKYCLTLKMNPKGFKNPSCFSGDFQQCIQASKTCPNTFCHNNPNCYFKQLARYRKALDEIEEVINNILNSCLGRNTVGCRPAHNVCGDLIKILDIINK